MIEESETKRRKVEEIEELEKDATPVAGAKLDTAPQVNLQDATLNVIPTMGGRVLAALTDGGLQYLLAGVRYNHGVKAGRYLYEVKMIEALNPSEPPPRGGRPPHPRQLVRIGFSTSEAGLFLGEDEHSVCFESPGFFACNQNRRPTSAGFQRDQVVGVLLNLDKSSPNANTVSMFVDGRRCSTPMPLPEGP